MRNSSQSSFSLKETGVASQCPSSFECQEVLSAQVLSDQVLNCLSPTTSLLARLASLQNPEQSCNKQGVCFWCNAISLCDSRMNQQRRRILDHSTGYKEDDVQTIAKRSVSPLFTYVSPSTVPTVR